MADPSLNKCPSVPVVLLAIKINTKGNRYLHLSLAPWLLTDLPYLSHSE